MPQDATPNTPPRARAKANKPEPQPGDKTGLQTQLQEAQRDEIAADKEAEDRTAAEQDAWEKQNTVVDIYADADQPLPEVKVKEDDDNPFRVVLIKFPVEQMAFGRKIIRPAGHETVYDGDGNAHRMPVPAQLGDIQLFNFEEGRRYRLPKPLADHLDEKGYVYH